MRVLKSIADVLYPQRSRSSRHPTRHHAARVLASPVRFRWLERPTRREHAPAALAATARYALVHVPRDDVDPLASRPRLDGRAPRLGKTPAMREVRKERVVLTDEEFSRFIACAAVDLELRMLSLVARCEGGMRTGDLHKWDWSMIDRVDFAECIIPRAKTRTPQRLEIPDTLVPFLRAWWARAGKPESGPVFPTRTGKRAGEAKRPDELSFPTEPDQLKF